MEETAKRDSFPRPERSSGRTPATREPYRQSAFGSPVTYRVIIGDFPSSIPRHRYRSLISNVFASSRCRPNFASYYDDLQTCPRARQRGNRTKLCFIAYVCVCSCKYSFIRNSLRLCWASFAMFRTMARCWTFFFHAVEYILWRNDYRKKKTIFLGKWNIYG